jgi:hypothetical protein
MKTLIWLTLLVLLAGSVFAANIEVLNENMEEKQIFAPGAPIVFKADSDDADNVNLVILHNGIPVITQRMKMVSGSAGEFAYQFNMPADFEQGDYVAKIISKGQTAEEEFFVGYEIKGQLMRKSQIDDIKKAGLLRYIIALVKFMLRKIIWIKIGF